MKNVNIIFLLFTSNVIVAMEAEHTSLASFFDLDKCTQHQDISKAIAQQYVSDKQWWYVDKEIQFDHQCCSDAPRWYVDEKNISKKNSFRRVLFNKNVTEIVAHPVHDLCYSICVWDRKNGTELERISHDDYEKAISSASYDKELWVNNRLYSLKYMCKLSVDDRSMLVQHASHDGTGAAFVMVQGPEISKVKVCGTDIESLCLVHDGFVRMAHFNPCNI